MSVLEKMVFHGNRILVEPIEEKKESNIIAPDSAKAAIVYGAVVKIGDGKEIVPGLEIGKKVGYERNHSTPMPIDDRAYFVVDGKNGVISSE